MAAADIQQPGRSGIATSITLTREAYRVLGEMLESPNKKGQFISALILAERARMEERAKCAAQLRAVYDGRYTGVDNID